MLMRVFAIAVDEDDCAGSPCHHGATCIDRVAGYECRCPGELSGVNCQLGKLSTIEQWFVPRGHAQSGGTLSKAVPIIEALAGYKQARPSPLHLSIIVVCIII